MKTTPMAHQSIGLELLKQNLDCYMLACEQGVGKTWIELADAEYQITEGLAEAMLVIAPKGVHTNWTLREIPTHVSIPYRCAAYSSGMSMRRKREVDRLFENRRPGELIVLAMNIDAVNFPSGYSMAAQFLKKYRCIMVVDESQRIKTVDSKRTIKVKKLGRLAVSRRCLSGTPITNSPGDIFSQFEFMAPGEALLGTTSYRAFVAEYTELLPESSSIMLHIKKQVIAKAAAQHREASPSEYSPQMPVKDRFGVPIYKNLAKLNLLLKPKMYRVLKKDCLDLPPKIYKTLSYDLNPAQQKIYNQADEELRLEFDGEIDIYSPLTKQTKLQQIAAGFILRDGDVTKLSEALGAEDTTTAELMAADENPRLGLLEAIIEDLEGSFIIWARFVQEIEQITALLRKMKIETVEYHGGVKQVDREITIDSFQSGAARALVGNTQSGGIGLTLTAAQTAIYYSQSCRAEDRWQSEDRNHRKGTIAAVVYIDIVANGTIDEKITRNLQSKAGMARSILDEVTE